jgi:pyruvate kinase
MRKTKIICTLGPASSDYDTLKAMVEAGMNVVRLNFSHGEHATHLEYIRTVRKVAADLKRPIAILQDLQGPKIRVGTWKMASFFKKVRRRRSRWKISSAQHNGLVQPTKA